VRGLLGREGGILFFKTVNVVRSLLIPLNVAFCHRFVFNKLTLTEKCQRWSTWSRSATLSGRPLTNVDKNLSTVSL
jgi:hypothetical protein